MQIGKHIDALEPANLKTIQSFIPVSIGYQVCGVHTSSMSKPVSSGISQVVRRAILKSESEAESNDLRRLSM